jgi:hypothetical protein
MAAYPRPVVGEWYQTSSRDVFEVVALDDDEGVIEIQYFDGSIEEVDLAEWYELELRSVQPPEDWAGSMDVSREDTNEEQTAQKHDEWASPFDQLDQHVGLDDYA